MNATAFFDESGNTGADFLHVSQPIFALACTVIDTETAKALASPLLRQTQTEVKYSKLKGSASGRKAIINLLNLDVISQDYFLVAASDKRFALVAQFIDKILEPAFYESGIDMYANDMAPNLATMIHHAGPHAFPDGRWDQFLDAFGKSLFHRSKECYDEFDRILENLNESEKPFFDIKRYLLAGLGKLDERLCSFKTNVAFDPAADSFVLLTSQLMTKLVGRFDVMHDESKPLKNQEQMLRLLMNPEATPTSIGYPGREMELPLRISKLSFGNSKFHPELQLADLIAGATVDYLSAKLGHRPMDSYREELSQTNLPKIIISVVAARAEISRSNSPEPGQKSLVDGMALFLGKS